MAGASPESEITWDAAARSAPADASSAPAQSVPRGAALGPAVQPISAAGNSLPADSAAEALGRRTLSTAFVRVGPDGLVTVQLHGGRTLVLRNLVMRRKKFCGSLLAGERAGTEYCGGYAEVAAARPGGAAVPAPADIAAPHPLGPSRR